MQIAFGRGHRKSRITRMTLIIAAFKSLFCKSMSLCCSLDSLEFLRETAYNNASLINHFGCVAGSIFALQGIRES